MIQRNFLWTLAKGLEGLGLLVVLWGLIFSVSAGMQDQTMKSQEGELYGLLIGGLLFFVGWLMERRLGER